MNLYELTIHEARARMAAGDLLATDLLEAVIERIIAVDDEICAYLSLAPEIALAQARAG